MPRFIIHFVKKVLGDNGREEEVRQCTVEVDASDKPEAREIAKRSFCELHSVTKWSDHADRLEIQEGDFPS